MLRLHVTTPTPSPSSLGGSATYSILWLKEALLLPPRVPGCLHVLRAVGVGHSATDIWGRGRQASVWRLGRWEEDGGPAEKGLGLCKSSPRNVVGARTRMKGNGSGSS